jgi:short-subunit dehydrogenase
MVAFKTILITGASSGIGEALALHYSAPGITLFLQGRNHMRLEAVAGECTRRGARAHTRIIDVTDAAGMEGWIRAADAQSAIDLVIANAGISAGTGEDGETAQQARRIFATNVDGVLNTIHPLIPLMSERGRGQIAIMSSLAGIRALPSCPAYSASKAGVRYWGESLRGCLADKGVGVSVICPGYIATPMTAVNRFPMPFMMSAKTAAERIADALGKNRGRFAFPRRLYVPLWLLSCLSPRLTDGFFARLPAKPPL